MASNGLKSLTSHSLNSAHATGPHRLFCHGNRDGTGQQRAAAVSLLFAPVSACLYDLSSNLDLGQILTRDANAAGPQRGSTFDDAQREVRKMAIMSEKCPFWQKAKNASSGSRSRADVLVKAPPA
jgi:hypothetical protein